MITLFLVTVLTNSVDWNDCYEEFQAMVAPLIQTPLDCTFSSPTTVSGTAIAGDVTLTVLFNFCFTRPFTLRERGVSRDPNLLNQFADYVMLETISTLLCALRS